MNKKKHNRSEYLESFSVATLALVLSIFLFSMTIKEMFGSEAAGAVGSWLWALPFWVKIIVGLGLLALVSYSAHLDVEKNKIRTS